MVKMHQLKEAGTPTVRALIVEVHVKDSANVKGSWERYLK
jgi:hypothetical protein